LQKDFGRLEVISSVLLCSCLFRRHDGLTRVRHFLDGHRRLAPGGDQQRRK